ncbi:MAG TPA: glycosyl hydrolase [Cytophagaceae bacterium]|nr:glycosyl hydrolase [Cytophagaceae bacterium]
MQKWICLFLLLIIPLVIQAQVSPKRGMAYGNHSVADLNADKVGASWWYNWSSTPDAAIASYYASQGVEFVPMMWNDSYTVANAIAQIPAGCKYLLAFNEPNFTGEANMTPAQAVAAWPKIEQIAAAKGLEIVSAVPAYCGGGACVSGYTDPVTWHNDFFSLCPTCKVDYIAFHNYEPTVGGLLALTNNLKVFGRPVWVTEFAYWDPTATEAAKISYLQSAVSSFENDPDIFRYAWFTGRSSSNNTVSLLGADGVLTNLGAAYIGAAYGPKNNIPGTIQVETMYRRQRTAFETCSDVGGGQDVGFTDPGTWNEYLVEISNTGSYTFKFRVASNVSTGSFNILLDGQVVKSNVTVASTGGWQTWTDLTVSGVTLTAGEHLLRFAYTGTGTNMNYFTTIFESSVPATADFSANPISVCVGNTVTFTDLTTNKTGGETYSWNFGSGASPATATGAGPHSVTYSTSGQKTPTLTVTNASGPNTMTKTNYINVGTPPSGCLFSDDYNDNTVNWINPIPGPFSHTESNSVWTVSNSGYGEWQNFTYTLNNGTSAMPLNFQCAANKPQLKIRAKASGNCLLSITFSDQNGRVIDNYNALNLELTTTYQTFTIDYTGKFRNYYGGSPGILDSTDITKLQLAVNPGFYSYPITGANGTYNSYFPGTIDIDWIGIGDNSCSFVLPIELVSFTATKNDVGSVLLEWTTASENNNDYFQIMRSTDGTNYTSAGTVNGAGTSSTTNNYSLTDAGLSNGTYYYKLKQVDFNGNSTYSSVINVTVNDPVLSVIMPTQVAAGDAIQLLLDDRFKQTTISLVDLTGKIYYSYNAPVKQIETNGLRPGLYMVKIVSEDQVVTKKITVY